MQTVSVFNIKNGGSAALSGTTAAAAVQKVPCGRDARLVLRVANAGTSDICVRLAAGDGPRAPLGAKDVAVAAGQTAYIALFDTARHKKLSDNTVEVALLAADGSVLDSASLAVVRLEAVQV